MTGDGFPASSDLHLPLRPSWRCSDDGTDWPCEVYKRRLWTGSGGRSVKVAERMARWMALARLELVGLSAQQLHDRFAGWIAAGPPARQVVVPPVRRLGNEPGA